MQERITRMPETVKLTGRSKSSIIRDEKLGTFPKRKKIGKYSVGYLHSEIIEWIMSRPDVNNKSLVEDKTNVSDDT